MKFVREALRCSLFLCLAVLLLPVVALAQHYKQTNLVSDLASISTPNPPDPNLKNPWGLTRSPGGSPWWIANNNSGTSTLYDGNGNAFPPPSKGGPLVVTVPPPNGSPAGTTSTPTGVVFNGSPTDFLVAPGKSAHFIFVTEDGTISGWNGGQNAVLTVDNSDNGSANGAVYKGATSGEINGNKFLYVTNFRKARVEIYDTKFKRVFLGDDAFEAEGVPDGFAPFNIQNIGGILFVTYAKQDPARHDDVAGDGLGFVELFKPSGRNIGHLQHGTWLNSPWGVVWTTRDFGEFSNAILVGNFGSGRIAAFNGFTYKFMGFVKNPDDSILTIDGLWSLTFGNDGTAGPANTLFFTAGINGEQDGLFGTITPVDGLDGDEE
ncbi:MAG: TIGR03118 family protein [Acidobacteria bacterium 13_2_20CM_2_57_6]|nr:MAG: TIGR03118 family protein [Acidobacteria bacterium 13_2_20CM_57_7]OLB89438.1 MAG: TIGR03118 family protein [Acidobacteria bacterium 13_2_20CM_2_57_6]PYT43059.1 MAG: TIGR03118 family protein [Acidobacteriota bacterium]